MTEPKRSKNPEGVGQSIIMTPAWHGLQQQILYLAQFGGSLQVVCGETGAGKTTFYQHLLAHGMGDRVVAHRVEKGVQAGRVFHTLLQELGFRPNEQARTGELIAALRGFVQTLQKERSRTIVLLDDAHHMEDSDLAALISVLQGNTDSGVGLHLLLFSQPGLADKIDTLHLLDVTAHDAHIPAFSSAEIKTLLCQHLNDAGTPASLDAEAVHDIWVKSGGLPGIALDLVDDALPKPRRANALLSFSGLPIGHLAALAVLGCVLVWVFLVRESNPPPTPGNSRVEQSTVRGLTFVSPADEGQRVGAQAEGERFRSEGGTGPNAVDHAADDGVLIDSSERLPGQAEPVHLDVVVGSPAGETGDVQQDSARSEPHSAQVDDLSNSAGSSASIAEDGAAAGSGPPPAHLKDVEDPREANRVLDTSEESVDHYQDQLLAYQPSGYVLQLMATGEPESLDDYIARQPNKANLMVYKTRRNDKMLYILVEGFYADKGSALAALDNLPPQQRRAGPWPKPISSVQKEIKDIRRD